MRRLTSLLLGVALGIIAARYIFVGSGLSLIPWSIAALALGYGATRRESVFQGALYGFALLFMFMVAAYTGAAPIIGKLPFFVLIGLAGALYGIILALLGSLLRTVANRL